ncbi:RNA-binding protein BRN1-like [Iris pallida]|uniref:RNA-binding protein BRN1-like n=1 Tax=Iris pallida TaxID=29817 RepID=A0AAX6E8W5_IRIPA|nr:RNA-binding protein BRN1-like [Iris pallida]
MEGSSVPLVVKWADTEKERQARRALKAQSQASNLSPSNSIQQPSVFGALPMGYMPPYNGYGYQAPGSYGLLQYPLASMQNQASFQNMIASASQGNSLRGINPELSPGATARNFATMQSTGYVGSAYPSVAGLQYPLAYHGGLMSHRPLGNSHGLVQPANTNNNSAGSPGISIFWWSD